MPHSDLLAQSEISKLKGTGGASRVGYTPAESAHWPEDPTDVGGALDDLAERMVDAIVPDADEVGYTPTNGAHWSDPDPTTAEEAFDDLGGRVDTLENATVDASGVDYTPANGAHWPDPDPSKLDGAVDGLADRVTILEGVDTLVLATAAGAEVGDVIPLTVTCTDASGASVPAARVLVEVFDASLAVDGASQAFDVSTGTALTGDLPGSNVRQLVQADSGSIVLDISDKTFALDGNVYVKLTPIDRVGATKLVPVTFA